MRDSAIIYRSFYEAIKTLPKESQADIWGAICEFALNENEVELTGISSAIFTLIKPQLEANLKRFKNGKQPKNKQTVSKTEAKPKQEESKTEANNNNNNNVNNNNNQNDNVIEEDTHTVFAKKLSSNELEIAAIQDSTRKIVTTQILKEFNAHLITESKHHSHYSQWMSHLRNWLNKKPEKEKSFAKKESYAESLLRANSEAKEYLKQMNDAEKD